MSNATTWTEDEQRVLALLETYVHISSKLLPAQKTPRYTNGWNTLLAMAPVDDSFPEDKPVRETLTQSKSNLWDEVYSWTVKLNEIDRHIVLGRAAGDSWKSIHVKLMQRYRSEPLGIRTLQRRHKKAVSYIALYVAPSTNHQ